MHTARARICTKDFRGRASGKLVRRRHLINVHCRISSTDVQCSWKRDEHWLRRCVEAHEKLHHWELGRGRRAARVVSFSCMRYTHRIAERNIFRSIPEISSIEMLMPHLLSADFNFVSLQRFMMESVGRGVYSPVEKSLGLLVFVEIIWKKT